MKELRTIVQIIGRALVGALLGPIVALIATALGCVVGALLEASLNITVYSWEMVPLMVLAVASPGSAAVSSLGLLTGRYKVSLVAGLLINVIVFAAALVPRWGSHPTSVSIWAILVGSIAGGAAGAIAGIIEKRRRHNQVWKSSKPIRRQR